MKLDQESFLKCSEIWYYDQKSLNIGSNSASLFVVGAPDKSNNTNTCIENLKSRALFTFLQVFLLEKVLFFYVKAVGIFVPLNHAHENTQKLSASCTNQKDQVSLVSWSTFGTRSFLFFNVLTNSSKSKNSKTYPRDFTLLSIESFCSENEIDFLQN